MRYADVDIRMAFGERAEEEYAPVAAGLRSLVPAPAPADFAKLEAEASRHRVLLLKTGAVIAVSTLLSVGVALLIHALFAGVVVAGWLYWPGLAGGGGYSPAGMAESGGGPGGFMVLDDGPEESASAFPAATTLARVLPPSAAVMASAPELPPLPEPVLAPRAAEAAAVMPAFPAASLGTVQLPGAPNGLASPKSAAASGEGMGDMVASGSRGAGAGDGGGDEERPLGLFRGEGNGRGGGGYGGGIGSGRGNGLDRGMSAADRGVQLLSLGASGTKFALPMTFRANPPEKSVRLVLTIAPDGTIASARVEQTCGIAEVDQLVRDWVVASCQFSPARRGGKAVSEEFHFEMSFGSLE